MGRINWGKVLLGGFAAGVVINLSEMVLNTVVLGEQMATEMRAHNLDPEGGSIAVWVFYAFLTGVVTIWLYAAIRPRFGAGPKTALIAAFVVWLLTHFLGNVAMMNIGLVSGRMMGIGTVWGLVELLVAGLVGASLYKEETV